MDFVRRRMPPNDLFKAWAPFSFMASSGRINECDLLVAAPGGLFLVELKAHPGVLTNSGDTWTFREQDGRKRYLDNPLFQTDVKSKELKDRLAWAISRTKQSLRLPWIEPAVFLTAPGLEAQLDEVQAVKVFARDGESTGLPLIWRDLLGAPPRREAQRLRPEFAAALPELMRTIGVRAPTAHLRLGEWSLNRTVLDSGPSWEDRLVERKGLVEESARARIYLTALQAAR